MKNNVATIQDVPLAEVPAVSTDTANMLMNSQVMAQLQQFAVVMASGKCTVPQHLRGSEGDCLAIAMQSAQWGMNPFAVAQKTHIVNGILGYEAQLVNAVISSSNAIKGRFHYEYSGDWDKANSADAAVRCGAILAGEAEITWGEPLYISKVTTKNSPLWKTAPKQQAAYLAVKYWSRMYCPDVILGVYTADELRDIPKAPKDITPAKTLEEKLALNSKPDAEVIEQSQPQDYSSDVQFMVEAINSCGSVVDLKQALADFKGQFSHVPAEQLGEVHAAYNSRKQIIEQEAK